MPADAYFERLLDSVCPFGVLLGSKGEVLAMGRTLAKIVGAEQTCFGALFDVTSPRQLRGGDDLARLCDRRLSIRLRDGHGRRAVKLRAHAVALPGKPRRYFLNTSLGTDMPELVEELGLGDIDFSYADPSVDMLYVLQTQQALLKDSHQLAARLSDAKEAAETLARTDPLTQIPNRRAFHNHLERILGLPVGRRDRLILLHIDLDKFKQVNDTIGHAAGDAVLMHTAKVLRKRLRDSDLAARIGGDEFTVVLTQDAELSDAKTLAHRLIHDISEPIPYEESILRVGASVGIAQVENGEQKSLDRLLLEADLALYEVKEQGRGRVRVFDEPLAKKYALVQDLSREILPAIENGEFAPYFQPQIDARNGEVIGVEVLARWNHPRLGVLTPGQFLYVADRARLTEAIDDSIRARTLQIFSGWRKRNAAPHHVAFNLTADRLINEGFVDRVTQEVDAHGLSPSEVCFELLESILIEDEDSPTVEGARRLSDAGFRLSLDDFGTGHASIASLISVPVSTVKIDRAFVHGVNENPRLRAMTGAIAGLAGQLGLDVLAEGVERREDFDALQSLGCHQFQGHFFAHPLAAPEFERWLAARDGRARDAG